MRERRTPTLAAPLVLALGSLFLMTSAALGASGLPATIGMEPAAAAPGSQVEVSGLDFPAGAAVELQVTTPAGPVHLATVAVAEGGYFRQAVTLPADAPAGFWELRATASDGATAAHAFEAGSVPMAVEPGPPVIETTSVQAASQGNSAADIMVMLIIALLIAAVGGALAYAWYQTHGAVRQPGMGAGDDPIWSNAGDEPLWGSSVTFDTTR